MANDTMSDLSIGWIGTGRMGFALADRLAKAGLDVSVWNRTKAKAEPLASHGAVIVDELGELAAKDVVFTMVSASHDLEEIAGKLLADPDRAPRIVVDCSTVSAQTSATVRVRLADRGCRLVAAPVSGNGKVVKAGRLTLVCSGDADAFVEVSPLLDLLGRHVTYVGDGEHARLVKICHNLLLGVTIQNLVEVTVLAEKGGVPRAAFLEFINNSVMGSVFSRYKTPALVNLDFTPTFTPALLRKDLDLGLAAANELGVPMPVVAAAREPVQAAIAQGRGDEDFAVLLELQAVSSGLNLALEDVMLDDGLGS
ncbi:MAG TPA: NAD(P)-dependent oxidoreductase [Pseudonocardiaceae bacterium]|nr:NAD(P)-dependent oxidoreductase [Pseudonocardiaceae bacterium]